MFANLRHRIPMVLLLGACALMSMGAKGEFGLGCQKDPAKDIFGLPIVQDVRFENPSSFNIDYVVFDTKYDLPPDGTKWIPIPYEAGGHVLASVEYLYRGTYYVWVRDHDTGELYYKNKSFTLDAKPDHIVNSNGTFAAIITVAPGHWRVDQ